jgi:hypothetical protein
MLKVPVALQAQFQGWLRINGVPNHVQSFYLKWLRYYLDFSRKYRLPAAQEESLDRFLDKLREKKQTTAQQEQACHAVKLYRNWLRPRRKKTRSARRRKLPFQQRLASHPREKLSPRQRPPLDPTSPPVPRATPAIPPAASALRA